MTSEHQIQDARIDIDCGIHSLTSATITTSEEEFRFGMMSYNAGRYYALHPKRAKRFYLLLKHRIHEYEKNHGTLEARLPAMSTIVHEQKHVGFKLERKESTHKS